MEVGMVMEIDVKKPDYNIKKIEFVANSKHHELLEDLAEIIFDIIYESKIVKKVNIKLEKLDIIKNTESVGIEVSKKKDE